ncbi:MAG TPA: hypothetical protein VMV31_11635 [Terriglobales bacterium]|nr:hypothetical protein [Terriglobales bacterium]
MKGKLDREEKALLASFEAGEWRPVPGGKELRKRYQRQAQAMFRKDRRVSLRIATRTWRRSSGGRRWRAYPIRP